MVARSIISSDLGRVSFTLSGALHLGVIALAVFGLPSLFQAAPLPLPLPVEIVSYDELSEITELEALSPVPDAPEVASKEPEPELAKTPPPVLPAPAAPAPVPPQPASPPPPAAQVAPPPAAPVAPQVTDLPQPVAEPEEHHEAAPELAEVVPPEEVKARPPAPKPVKAAEAKAPKPEEDKSLMAKVAVPAPRARPLAEAPKPGPQPSPVRVKTKTPEPKKTEALDPLASVLRNVQRDLKPQVKQRQQEAAKTQKAEASSLDQRRKSAQIVALIQQQVRACWRIDAGATNAQDLKVPVRFRLQRDGRVVGQPEFQDMSSYLGNSFYQAAADNARRAILDCQPFELPTEDYDLWKDLVLTFNPAEMF